MATNPFRTVARHHSYDQSADHRNEDFPRAQPIPGGRNQRGTPALIEEQVSEQADKPQQPVRNKGAEDAYADGKAGERNNVPGCGEISQAFLVSAPAQMAGQILHSAFHQSSTL